MEGSLIMFTIIGGLVAAAAILFLVFKLGDIRKILAFDVLIDIGSTVALSVMLAGTLGGMMIALTAGFFISIFLWALKKFIGSEKLTRKGWVEGSKPQWKTAHLMRNLKWQ